MTTCNPEIDDMLTKWKTFKTLCAAFPAWVRKLNGEYGLWFGLARSYPPPPSILAPNKEGGGEEVAKFIMRKWEREKLKSVA